jgi:CheY-like chemotaxis protein
MRDFKPSLLVVDDALPIRMSLLSMLTALHYAVRVAPDGLTALAEIRKEAPDLILSELNMPGMSGFDLLSLVRRRFPSIRVIAMSSGFFGGGGVPPGVAADAYYPKEAHPGLLLQLVEDITRPGDHR